jgi:hypothetical protein
VTSLVGCNNGHSSSRLGFQELEPIMDSYLSQNEKFGELTIINSDEKFPKPSFQMYLYKWNNDTVVSIFQRPFLVDSHILGKELSDSVNFYADIKTQGLIEYKKSPFILFDPDKLLDPSFVNSLRDVPDEYKFQGQNIHWKSTIWDFILKNGEFERDDREIHLIEREN